MEEGAAAVSSAGESAEASVAAASVAAASAVGKAAAEGVAGARCGAGRTKELEEGRDMPSENLTRGD